MDDWLNSCLIGSDWGGLDEFLKRTWRLVATSNGDPSKSNAVAKAWKHNAE